MNVKLLTRRPLSKLLLCLVVLVWVDSVKAAVYEDLDNIRTTAEQFALKQVDTEGLSDVTAHAASLDARLTLAKCEESLEPFTTSRSASIARTTIGIRCTGTKPWTLYVPITISAMTTVVYSARSLIRGEVIQDDALEIKVVSITKVPTNFLSSVEQLAGLELTRSISSGQVISMNMLKVRQLVQQGQEVIILAKSGGIQVRMSGLALKNGSAGDLIPIKNIKSGRTIEAMIVNENTVTVSL